jgi:diguanylate cyclase (GGDEF)-like protein/PAS domain S-box-containing protein
MPRRKATLPTLRLRLSPLAIRLAVIAYALMLPILWLAAKQRDTLEASLSIRTVEATSVHWIVLAERLASLQGLPAVLGSRSKQEIRQQIASLRGFEAANVVALPAAPPATANIEAAWTKLLSRPTARSFGTVTGVTYQGLSSVPSASLSMDTDTVLADLGDALDNAYFQLFAPLMSATAATQIGWRRGGLTLEDRIVVAGLLARSNADRGLLESDMTNAFEHRPELRETVGAPYAAALAAASGLETAVATAIRSPSRTGDAARLEAKRDALAARTDSLLRAFEAAARTTIEALQVETEGDLRRLYLQTTLIIVLDFAAVFFAGQLITRRYRYEIERAKEQARMLSTEIARQRAEHEQMLTQAQFTAIFDRSQMGIALLDRAGATMECNPALSENLGRSTPAIVPPDDARFAKLIAGFEATYQYEGPLARADGTIRWAQITVSSIDVPQSEAVAAIAIVQDITDRKEIDERLRFEAAHDELTLLPNRAEFLARVDALIMKGADLGRFAVLFIDLDKFKLVNDTLGHTAGDRVIAIAAQRLVATTRPGDIVARLHGDEFAVVVKDLGNEPGEAIADRIKQTFLTPITIDGTTLVLTASVGIVPGLGGYRAAESVLRDADVAMYNAKKLGRSTAVTFDGDMHERLGSHMRMLTEIRLAIEREEFRLVYQPIVELASGVITGVEALMRWHHPTLGIVSPVDFIPVAEETDAIEYLGRLALREACAMLARMDAAGMPRITASVNLSVPHLSNGEVIEDVRSVLDASGIAASRLMLEITESALLENGTRAANVLDELSALGVRLCIDDFGTGYSSLRYLHEYPIDVLKIDRSFVYAESGGLANEPIVHMLLTLARSLNMSAIAEGIETAEQRDALVASGCRSAQGYFFARPLSEPNLMRWIDAQQAAGNSERATVA